MGRSERFGVGLNVGVFVENSVSKIVGVAVADYHAVCVRFTVATIKRI